MVRVTRAADDGWEREGFSSLTKHARPLAANIDNCTWVKSFGNSLDHAREINLLMNSLGDYLAAGLLLSMDPMLVSFGYTELPPCVARMNGSEWSGFVFGVNLHMSDLLAVVEWGAARDKESQ